MTKNVVIFAVFVASASMIATIASAQAGPEIKPSRRGFILGASALTFMPFITKPFKFDAKVPDDMRARELMKAAILGTVGSAQGLHPLRLLLHKVFWPQPGKILPPNYVFWSEYADPFPEVMLVHLQNVARDIVEVQDKLSVRFNVPLERIEREMRGILLPQFDFAIWVNDYGPDPFPQTLGFKFRQAFYDELEQTQPRLANELRDNAKPQAGTSAVFAPRFDAPAAVKRYIELTGTRLSMSGHQAERLRVSFMEQEPLETVSDSNNTHQADSELRALIEWLKNSKTDLNLRPPKLTVSKLAFPRPRADTLDLERKPALTHSCRGLFL